MYFCIKYYLGYITSNEFNCLGINAAIVLVKRIHSVSIVKDTDICQRFKRMCIKT